MKLNKQLIPAVTISMLLAACGSDTEPTVPMPNKPEPLVPAPETFTTQIGDMMVTATKEELVVTSNTEDDKLSSVEVFKGIRFAEAERFEHSNILPLSDNTDEFKVIDATSFGDACPQLKAVSQEQSEDCLNLNIWRPVGVDADADLPVYVFIHGGDFEYGSGAAPLIQGDNVVAQGASEGNPFIYVSFNYRLGLLGSMWVDDEKGGNFGIGDQKRALQWVNENISKFGGNAEDVTLMGQGSGAMSVGILQQTSSHEPIVGENGYFNRSIMQSNTYGFEYQSYDSAEANSTSICEATGVSQIETGDNTIKSALNLVMLALPDDIKEVLAPIVDEMDDQVDTTVCVDNYIERQKQLPLSTILEAQDKLLNPINKTLDWVVESLLTLQKEVPLLSPDNNTPMANLLPFAPYNEYHKKSICVRDCDLGYHFVTQPALDALSVPTVIGNNEKDANTMSMLPTLTFLIPKILDLLGEDADNGTFESLNEGNKDLELAVWLQVDGNQQRVIDMISSLPAEEVQAQIELDDALELLPSTAYEAVTKLFFGLGNAEFNNGVLGLSDYAPWSENELGGATKNMSQFKTLMNDMLFQAPARNQAIRSSLDMNAPVSMYHFAFKPSFNVWTYNTNGENGGLDIGDALKTVACISGACSGSELPFVFNKPFKSDGTSVHPTSKDQALMNDMSRLWFSDSLFSDYTYSKQLDNVLSINSDGSLSQEVDWDSFKNTGEDTDMRNGRLQGLNDLDLTLKYMPDYAIPAKQ